MRPDAMQLTVVLGSTSFGVGDPEPDPDGELSPGQPITVQINGRFGDLDPLSTEDAQALLPKLAYLFEGLVKEHQARQQAQLQRLALLQQAAAQAEVPRTGIVKTGDQEKTLAQATDQEAPDVS
jgi:hypothetical protein